MHKLEIKLKQHTPLIHFQHDQEGATLRASEVKPKLDKFLLTRLGQGNYQAGIAQAKTNGWLIGKGDHPALDYKMKIEASENRDEYMLTSYIKSDNIQILKRQSVTAINNTPYFAQEKQNAQIIKSKTPKNDWDKIEKKGILCGDLISVTLVSQKMDMLNKVSSIIQPFFLVNNFGTRQSKGFGCFSVTKVELDGNRIVLENAETLFKQHFLFVYKKILSQGNIETILSTINDDYRLLKSGRTRPYAKSKLMLYAYSLDKTVGWDKKYIKVNTNDIFEYRDGERYTLLCKKENEHANYASSKSYYYYRALLGLAEQFEFLLENPPMGDRKNKMIVKVKNNEIQRYQSPILFKVLDNTIYLVGNEVAPEMLGKPFQFLVNFQKDRNFKDEPVIEDGTPILTPRHFSMRDFLAFAMNDNTNRATLGYSTIKK